MTRIQRDQRLDEDSTPTDEKHVYLDYFSAMVDATGHPARAS